MEFERWLYILGYFAIVNLVGLLLMYLDKRRAVARRRRVSERVLLSLAAVGGGPGIYFGMRWRRHKTAKASFRIGVPLLSLVYVFVFLWWTYRMLLTME